MIHPELDIILNVERQAIIIKNDKCKAWPNNDCSDKTLLKYLDRDNDCIERIKYLDVKGIGDGIEIFFK